MERVVQFETKRKTSPGFDMLSFIFLETERNPAVRRDDSTGAAWLSSARAVRCSLKWGNERNPRPMLNYSLGTALVLLGRKEGKTSSQHGPYALGYTHTTMAKNNGLQAGNGKLIP